MDIDPTMVDPDEERETQFSDLKDVWESTKVGSSEDLFRDHGNAANIRGRGQHSFSGLDSTLREGQSCT